MNDSSSRSHCFAFLTLRCFDPDKDTVTTSRFQFVDLAGSERMKDAHGSKSWKDGDEQGEKLVASLPFLHFPLLHNTALRLYWACNILSPKVETIAA